MIFAMKVKSPVFFGGTDVEIHSALVQFRSLKMVKSEKVGIEIRKAVHRNFLDVSQW